MSDAGNRTAVIKSTPKSNLFSAERKKKEPSTQIFWKKTKRKQVIRSNSITATEGIEAERGA